MTINGTFYDASTGITENRLLTDDELAVLETNAKYTKEKAKAEATKAQAKAALLAKLGITADEAALLLG